MEISTQFVLFTTLCFYLRTSSTHARDFLSIDCGAAKGYTDERNIEWVTDEDFIQTGKNLQLVDAEFPPASLKYFPEGRSKNCFVLPVKDQTTYLLRASFDPGNATSNHALGSPIDFSVTVNSNLWFVYSASDDSRPSVWTECIFHTFRKNTTHVCLLKGKEGYPFINAVELRELNITSYDEVQTAGKFMVYWKRYNAGTKPNDQSILRFPDDPYDRIWLPTPSTEFPGFSRVENVSLPQDTSDYQNLPPRAVLQDAWVGRNLSTPSFPIPEGVNETYVATYFREIRAVNLTDFESNPVDMILDVHVNFLEQNEYNLTLTDLTSWSVVWNSVNVENSSHMTLTVTSQSWSERDAILNGFEMHILHDLDISATYTDDRTTLSTLQKSFKLQDWTGDPCYPVAWDWLECDPETSRISKLLLSQKNISGSIPEEIGDLLELTEIHLDNNSLTGSIPESIGSILNLTILALDNNNLSGQIPSIFQNRPGFTFSGNPGLCLPGNGSCETSAPAPKPVSSHTVKSPSDEIGRKVSICVVVALGIINLLEY